MKVLILGANGQIGRSISEIFSPNLKQFKYSKDQLSILDNENLLEVFWKLHDPTTLNRQGPDIGTQYRSAILYHSEDQLKSAKISLANQSASGEHMNPIVTEITPNSKFYRAEEYHQRYFEKQGRQ